MLLAKIKSNWRTSVAGVASLLSGLGMAIGAFVSGKVSPEVLTGSIGLISTGIGLLFGKDF